MRWCLFWRGRALVPLLHMSESGSARAASKFKEGQKVAARVLEADSAARRITLSLKKALCGDKLPPFSAWEVRCLSLHYSVCPFSGTGLLGMRST